MIIGMYHITHHVKYNIYKNTGETERMCHITHHVMWHMLRNQKKSMAPAPNDLSRVRATRLPTERNDKNGSRSGVSFANV
jgi:hypothetical protein